MDDDAKVRKVFEGLVGLLISYEVESVCLQRVLTIAENEFKKIDQGKDPGLRTAFASLASTPATRIAAEQRFVKMSQLQKSLSGQNLDLALSGIRDVIARKNGQPMPD